MSVRSSFGPRHRCPAEAVPPLIGNDLPLAVEQFWLASEGAEQLEAYQACAVTLLDADLRAREAEPITRAMP